MHKDTEYFITTPATIEHGTLRQVRMHDTYPEIADGDKIRLVVVSDTHSHADWTSRVPAGDVLIHCGDLTRAGTYSQLLKVYSEIKALPHKVKIVIAGNHDLGLDPHFVDRHAEDLKRLGTGVNIDTCRRIRKLWKSREASGAGIHFLEHEYTSLTIKNQNLHFFGSPCTPEFFDWAFMYRLHENIWSEHSPLAYGSGTTPSVPNRTEGDKLIFITHGPAKGILDKVVGVGSVGCPFLTQEIEKQQPDMHFFGHIHEGAEQGLFRLRHRSGNLTTCVNAALLDERYRLTYQPTVIDL